MQTPANDSREQLANFLRRHQARFPDHATEFDPEWPSPCELGQHFSDQDGQQWTRWQPIELPKPATVLDRLENALEFPLHPDLKTHYGSYYAANLQANSADGDLTLLYLWNQQDEDRLIENLIGHAIACRNNKTPFAGFFAVAEPDSDVFLTINNDTGAIQAERPGFKPFRTIADNLADFMQSLEPGWTGDS